MLPFRLVISWGVVVAEERTTARPEGQLTTAEGTQHWRAEPDLAPVRDPAELTKIPAVEREDRLELWAEVEAVLNRTQKAK